MQTRQLPVAVVLMMISLTATAQGANNDGVPAGLRELVAQALPQAGPPGEPAVQGQQAARQAPPSPTPDPARLEFDLIALIARLADEMDKEFILDARMRGMMGVASSGDDADYDTLLAMLRTNGFAAIEVGDQIRIVPEQMARGEYSRILQQDDARVSDHTVITRVIDVGDIEAADPGGASINVASQLIPILRPLMSTQIGNVISIPGTSKLVLVDRYDNIRRITALINELKR